MNLTELAAKKAELDALMKEHGKSAITETMRTFFDKYPDLTISWTQYTPHFNDGDTCEFHLHGVYVMGPGEDDEGEHELGSSDFWKRHPEYKPEWFAEPMGPDFDAMDKLINDSEEALKAAFGDHVKVIASRNGVEVEEYDHD